MRGTLAGDIQPLLVGDKDSRRAPPAGRFRAALRLPLAEEIPSVE